jgi:hypothetical protein
MCGAEFEFFNFKGNKQLIWKGVGKTTKLTWAKVDLEQGFRGEE